MTESEAIEELRTSINLAKMCEQNRERKKEILGYEMAIQALEKQIPKKPLQKPYMVQGAVVCPICEFVALKADGYCSHCGQHLDWGDEK